MVTMVAWAGARGTRLPSMRRSAPEGWAATAMGWSRPADRAWAPSADAARAPVPAIVWITGPFAGARCARTAAAVPAPAARTAQAGAASQARRWAPGRHTERPAILGAVVAT